MRSVISVSVLAALIISTVGCSTMSDKIDPTAVALAYYQQPRTYEPVTVEGIATLTLTAAEGQSLTVRLTSQLEPLSIYPRDPSTLGVFLDGMFKLGTVAASGIVGYEMVQGLSRGPTVVEQPAPIILEKLSERI